VIRGPLAFRAVALLLAFGLGGLALPLAHEVDHLLDGLPAAATQEAGVLGDEDAASGHDCTLCDVRFAALDAAAVGSTAAAYALPDAHAPVSPLARAPALAFSGRAPPVVV